MNPIFPRIGGRKERAMGWRMLNVRLQKGNIFVFCRGSVRFFGKTDRKLQ